jgi:glycogen synthase
VRVVRLCSVFEPRAATLRGPGVRLDPIGGMQTHTAALTRELDTLGVVQTVVTAYRTGSPVSEQLGERSRVLRVGLPLRRLRQLYAPPAAAVTLRAGRDADLVHVHVAEDLAVVPIGLATARLHGLPLVVTVHTSLPHTLAVVDLRTALLKRVGGRIETWGARRAAAIIVLTPGVAAQLRSDCVDPGRLHVIPSGVEAGIFDRECPDPFPAVPRPRILFVGRLARQKDVGTLLRAAPYLRTPNAQLILVGDGPERRRLEAEAARLRLDGRAHFVGFVPHDDVPAALAHADVLALPSVYEELGSVLLEAMWAGVPIVASRTGGIGDVLVDGENGLLVSPREPRSLAAALDRVLTDGGLASALAERGRTHAAAFDWRSLARRVLAVYEDTVASCRASAS